MNHFFFPNDWKVSRSVLLKKPDKPPESLTSFRPICLLNTIGKLLERIIANRLYDFIESNQLLSRYQFGFRRGCSTVDAIKRVVDIVDCTNVGNCYRSN